MSCTDDSIAGPSSPKKIKIESDESEEYLDDESDEYSSDFNFENISDYNISDSEDEDDKQLVHTATCQPHDSAMEENIIWENDSTSMMLFPFTKSECLLQPVSGDNPIDYFFHFLKDNILDEIITQTNDYAHKILCHHEKKQSPRINTWKNTTKDELLVFVGLILHMGTIRINRIQDYWKTDPLFGLRVFSNNMSRNRFLLLLKTLHFAKTTKQNSISQKDKLYKIRNMVNMFNERLSEIYYPGREICLDESMILWRGRLLLRQHVPNELLKYGIKLYMITTPNGMVLKFVAFAGKLNDSSGKEHTQNITLNLLDGMLDVGHSIFIDTYYNSYELVKCLTDRKTHCTGIMKKNGETFPKEVSEKKLKKGQTVESFANGVMIAKWKDKKDITYISNEFLNDIVEMTKSGKVKSKPLPVVQYHKFMSGIDKHDQMLSYYPCEKKKIKWPIKIFVHILQMMMINSHIIYNKYSNGNLSFYDFRLSVIRCLLKEPTKLPASISVPSVHIIKPREEKNGKKRIRKQCKNCYLHGKRKDTIFVCTVCEGSPGYCLECAMITHTKS
ncbi:piggyBac transposable element-derived protein 4 [Trichonephila inaurata madagascariensis]|uniref:PiggyBac transposable element-derived protein 4 n=1 Tax=Trichonephila inaurata madagascariensis TaxID=2747483 RepID=A0A8X6YX40_9ARAC|nr:piggyBac transposable element-derived protein 4 [Trichonephila inaurata madagascariensis]